MGAEIIFGVDNTRDFFFHDSKLIIYDYYFTIGTLFFNSLEIKVLHMLNVFGETGPSLPNYRCRKIG